MSDEIETLRARIAELEQSLRMKSVVAIGLQNRADELTRRAEKAEAALTEARDRLAEAQSDAEKWRKDSILMLGFVDVLEEHGIIPSSSELLEARDRAIAKSREQGFCAGIEAAAEKARIHMLGMSRERSDKMQKAILALSPSDKPAAPSVAEAENDGPYTCRSCCAATWNDSDVCDDCALAAREADTPPSDSKEIAG